MNGGLTPRALNFIRRRKAILFERAAWQDYLGRPQTFQGTEIHLNAALGWMERAIAATKGQGVSAHYSLGIGWGSGYPETTGYIVPTLLHAADLIKRPALRQSAVNLSDWLLTTQRPSGGFPGGELRLNLEETVFNTGQIIRGLIAIWRVTREQKYLDSALRGGAWLMKVQSPEDGAWRKFTSPLTTTKEHAYDVLTAWGLYLVGNAVNSTEMQNSAVRQYQWVISQQCENSFFRRANFEEGVPPLTHSLAYVIEGLFEVALQINDPKGMEACHRFLISLKKLYGSENQLPGRLAEDFRQAASWSCVTGNIQFGWMAVRVGTKNSDSDLVAWGKTLIETAAATQPLNATDPNVVGGVFGSRPISGAYFPYTVLNWSTKYLIDALTVDSTPRDTPAGMSRGSDVP